MDNTDLKKSIEQALGQDYKLPDTLSVFNKIDLFLLRKPLISTWLVAFCLASVWLSVWMLVLFLVTYSSGSSTSAYVLVAGLLLSTVAEAIIRLCENYWRLERWSRGTLHREIDGLNYGTAVAWVLLGVILIILLPDLTTIQEVDFSLQGMPKDGKLQDMLACWVLEFQKYPKMKFYIVGSLVLRTIIYKRQNRTVKWSETVLHVTEALAKLERKKEDADGEESALAETSGESSTRDLDASKTLNPEN